MRINILKRTKYEFLLTSYLVPLFLFKMFYADDLNVLPLAQAIEPPLKASSPELEHFVFGAPKVVLTHSPPVNILEWFPDRNEILLTTQQLGTITETIGLLHLSTLNTRECGQRAQADFRPLWLDGSQKVVYTARADQRYDLWVTSCGESRAKQPTVKDVVAAVTGHDQWILTIQRGESQGRIVNGMGKPLNQRTIDIRSLGFDPDNELTHFRMDWSPNGSMVVLFDTQHFVLLDLDAGSANEIKLEDAISVGDLQAPWVYQLRWSPNGRMVALLVAQEELALSAVKLVVLDTVTSKLKQIDLPFSAILDFTWDTDSKHILLVADLDLEDGRSTGKLFLVDSSGRYRAVLPNHMVSGGTYLFGGGGLLWSPDGHTIFVRCPVWSDKLALITEDRICAIPVDLIKREPNASIQIGQVRSR